MKSTNPTFCRFNSISQTLYTALASRRPYGTLAVHEHVQIDLWNPRGAEHALVLRHADRHGVPDQQRSHLFAVQVAFEKHRLVHDRSGPKRRHFQEIFKVSRRGIPQRQRRTCTKRKRPMF